MTKLCIPLISSDSQKILSNIPVAIDAGAEVIEIWLGDLLDIQNMTSKEQKDLLSSFVSASSVPLLATCKGEKEKGNFLGNEEEKISLLAQAFAAGFSFVDTDFETDESFVSRLHASKKEGQQIVLSAHFFAGTPNIQGLLRRFQVMEKKQADMVKFAAMPQNFKDVLTMMRLAEKLTAKKKKHIVIAMGKRGMMTRFFSPMLQNEMMFAPLEYTENDLGQVSAEELQMMWKKQVANKI